MRTTGDDDSTTPTLVAPMSSGPQANLAERSAPISSRRRVARALLLTWFPLVTVISGTLLGAHLLTLPTPKLGDPKLSHALAAARSPGARGKTFALHFLGEECGCSELVLEHLLARGPQADVERIVYVAERYDDSTVAKRASERGFEYEQVAPEKLSARYPVEAVPLFVVVNARDEVQYVGGYTHRKRGPEILDTDILARIARGEHVEPLPAFGCSVSRALSEKIDPLGLR